MTQQQQTIPPLKPRLILQQPAPDQEFPVGVNFTVSGKALGVDGDVVQTTITSVTVQLDSGPLVNASLKNPTDPHAPPTEMDFSITMQLPTPGNHSLTVKAIDDVGGWTSRTVVVSTPGTTHCASGVVWQNYPQTASLYPQTASLVPFSTCTPESLDDIIAIVREAGASNKHVHAFGSKWSLSDCAPTGDYVIDTTHLTRPLQTVQQALTPGQHPPLYHVEAGITIQNLYYALDKAGLALETMGGSSGQTLAGAVSTGTHGGDYLMGPLADSVLALHLVGAGGTQYWIEPSSGITDPALLQKFVVPGIDPKNIIYDDETFDACLVSLGCMGVIYAVVLRVHEPYDLVETTVATTWRGFLPTAAAHLNDPFNRFLLIVIDPYTDSNNDNFCLVTTRKEAPATSVGTRPTGDVKTAVQDMIGDLDCDDRIKLLLNGVFDDTGLTIEERFAKIVQGILTQTPDQRHVMVEHFENIMQALWPTGTFRGLSYSVMDTTFGQFVEPSRPAYSIELFFESIDINGRLGFPDFVGAVIAAINAATETLLTGWVALRFTKSTRACLGMQQWNNTCAVEISVVQGVQGELELLTALLDKVYQFGGLPHWGQLIDLNVQGQGTIYPRFKQWKQVYARLSNNFANRMFENALSSRWKLTTPDVAFFPGDGHLWHTERRHDGSWSGLGDVNAQFAIPGPVQAVSATSSRPGETQFLFATADGHLWHTVRRHDGSWSGLGDVNAQFAIPGAVRAVAAASSQPGESQFLFATADGHLWHTQRLPDGSWSGLGDVNALFAIPGSVRVVSATSSQPGETQFMFATEDGHLWHSERRSDGSWSGLGDVNALFIIPGPVCAVSATSSQPGETQFMFATGDGHLWHTERRPDGSWSRLGDVNAQFAIPGEVRVVSATSSQPGESQFLFATEDGHLWHTERQSDGSWSGLGDVNAQFAIPEAVRAVAAASSQPGESQFLFNT